MGKYINTINMEDATLKIIEKYNNGDIHILQAVTDLKKLKDTAELVVKWVKDFQAENFAEIEKEAKEYQGKYAGYSIEVRQGRKIFDYSGILEIQKLESKLKERQLYYKTAFEAHQKNIMMADYDGCEIELPELNYAKGSIILKEAK